MPANLENSAMATGLEKVSFRSNPKEGQWQRMLKLLHLFHMRARSCSKSFKLVFNSMWTKNSQMYNFDLEKKEEPDIKWNHGKSRGIPEKIFTSALLTMLKPSTVWIIKKTVENSSKDGNNRPLYHLLRNLCAGQEAIVKQTWNNRQVQNWERSTSRLYIVTLLI